MDKKPSKNWYILSIFFGILVGFIGIFISGFFENKEVVYDEEFDFFSQIQEGYSLNKQGNYNESIKVCEKVIKASDKELKIDYSNPKAWFYKAEAWRLKGINFKEMGKYEDAIKAYDEAINAYELAQSLNFSDYKRSIYLLKGAALLTRGDYFNEIGEYNNSIRMQQDAIKLFKEANYIVIVDNNVFDKSSEIGSIVFIIDNELGMNRTFNDSRDMLLILKYPILIKAAGCIEQSFRVICS